MEYIDAAPSPCLGGCVESEHRQHHHDEALIRASSSHPYQRSFGYADRDALPVLVVYCCASYLEAYHQGFLGMCVVLIND